MNVPNLGVGVGLRTVHYGHVLSRKPEVDLFEVLTDNYLDTGGRPLHVLDQVASRYPILMHGVSLSIGSTEPLDRAYIARVKALAVRTGARLVSDHVCWTGVAGRNLHDLLPLPYDEQTLAHVVERIRVVQDLLERPLFLENPSTYLAFARSAMTEWEFLGRMCADSGCGLLLDINNVFVSGFNNGFEPLEYLHAMPWERVGYFHMAGHTDAGTHRLDTHSDRALPEVWELYELASRLSGGRTTIYEWDADIPPFDELLAEALKARTRLGCGLTPEVPARLPEVTAHV